MKRFIKKSLYKIFVSLFIVFYTFVPPAISIAQVVEDPVYNPIPSSVTLEQWATKNGGNWITGALGTNNSDYKEEEVVPFRLDLGKLDKTSNPYTFSVCRDYQKSGIYGYLRLETYDSSRTPTTPTVLDVSSTDGPFSGVNIEILSQGEAGQGSCGAGLRQTDVIFNVLDSTEDSYALWGGYLSSPNDDIVSPNASAAYYPGGSLSMRVKSSAKNLGIKTSAIIPIQLASITVTKEVENGTALPDDWCFSITPVPDGDTTTKCILEGQTSVTFSGLVTGDYTITEFSDVIGYHFVDGDESSNCVFNGDEATASVIAVAPTATNAACTFHNALDRGTLTVIKHVVNDDGGQLIASNFQINVTGNNPSQTTFAGSESPGTTISLDSGEYSVDETTVSGYQKTLSEDCSGTINDSESKVCTITNSDMAPTLKLVKDVENDNGGTKSAADWTLTATGDENGFSDSGNSSTFHPITAGVEYTLSESEVFGYEAGDWTCEGGSLSEDKITLSLGEVVTCTITNDDIKPKLTVTKIVDPGKYGSEADDLLSVGEFPLFVSGVSVNSGEANEFDADDYIIYETGQFGYTSEIGTEEGDGCDADGNVTLNVGEEKSCTITNTSEHGKIIIKKETLPDGDTTDFTFTGDISGTISDGEYFEQIVLPGEYSVSETIPTDWHLSDITCVGDDETNSGDYDSTVVINIDNQETVTCTFTNAKKGSITGYKYNDLDGNLTTTNDQTGVEGWTITLYDESERELDSTTTDNNGYYQFTGVIPTEVVGSYTLKEKYPVAGWIVLGGDTILGVTVQPGLETPNQNFYNFQNAYVTSCKVDTDGDPIQGWDLTLEGNENIVNNTKPTEANGCVIWTITHPDDYTITEEDKPGWTQIGNTSYQFTAKSGQDYGPYTFKNFEYVTIKVDKDVWAPDGSQIVDNHSFEALLNNSDGRRISESTTATYTITQPGSYTISESNDDDYDFVGCYLSTGAPATNIDVESGDTYDVVCINKQKKASLTLVKDIIRENNGNELEDDFTVRIDGREEMWGTHYLNPDTYEVSEDDPTSLGYTQGLWTCVDDNIDQDVSNPVILSSNQSVTCTITNYDVAPKLTLVKYVTNDNGGDALASEWVLSATGESGMSGNGIQDVEDPTLNKAVLGSTEVKANMAYLLGESGPTGYTDSGWICDSGYYFNGYITLDEGANVTCKITNDDIAPGLTVYKYVKNNNGGDAVVRDFDIELNDIDLVFDLGMTADNTTPYISNPVVMSNVEYTLTEDDIPGYEEGTWSCEDNITRLPVSHPVTLSEGQSVSCMITNDDIAPKLTIIKNVISDNSNSGDARIPGSNDFVLTVGGSSVNSGGIYEYDANTPYAINETQLDGYEFIDITGDLKCPEVLGGTIELDEGDDITCTITNDDIAPTLKVVKEVVNDDGGNATIGDFEIKIDSELLSFNTGVIKGDTTIYSTNTLQSTAYVSYYLSETPVSGYEEGDWVCVDNDNTENPVSSPVVLSPGQNVTCTITNDDIAPTITLIKDLRLNYGGTAGVNDFCLTVGTTGVESGEVLKVDSNTDYMINEAVQTGYEFVEITGDEGCPISLGEYVNLDEGENLTCTITNRDLPAALYVEKRVLGRDHIDEGFYSDDEFMVSLTGYGGSQSISDTGNEETDKTAEFEYLSRGSYTLTEEEKEGYAFGGCYEIEGEELPSYNEEAIFEDTSTEISLENGETKSYVCYNDAIRPQLIISKSNNTGEADMLPGETVTYTITVTTPVDNEDGGTYLLRNVEVIDIIPDGFEYILGTAKIDGTSYTVEYDDGIPATWILGEMKEGESKVLTYQVRISEVQDPGIYDDLAYTYGDTVLTDVTVLGVSAINHETAFVGTEVTVIAEDEMEEGEVLGAAIELPATGAETYITLGVLISMILGMFLLIFNPNRKVKNLVIGGILLIGIASIAFPGATYAEEAEEPQVNIQIEQPETPTSRTSFKIGYVALPIPAGTDIDVKCYEETLGLFQTDTINNFSGSCLVDDSIITESGTYKFYVTATLDGETDSIAESDTVTVVVDLDKPSPVTEYSKTEGICSYTLKFKTGDNTSKIQIFRSSEQPFTANGDTLVEEMSVDSNKEYTYVDDSIPSCDKEYYYAIRAVDEFNNVSTMVTDDIITIILGETTTTETTTGGETGEVEGETTGEDGTGGNGEEQQEEDDNGEVAGEETTSEDENVEETEDGEDKDEEDKNGEEKSFWNEYKYVIMVVGGMLLAGVGYWYVQKKRK